MLKKTLISVVAAAAATLGVVGVAHADVLGDHGASSTRSSDDSGSYGDSSDSGYGSNSDSGYGSNSYNSDYNGYNNNNGYNNDYDGYNSSSDNGPLGSLTGGGNSGSGGGLLGGLGN